jgi:hypothetical protein
MKTLTKKRKSMNKTFCTIIQKKRRMWNVGHKKDIERCFQARRRLLLPFFRTWEGRLATKVQITCILARVWWWVKHKAVSSEIHCCNIFGWGRWCSDGKSHDNGLDRLSAIVVCFAAKRKHQVMGIASTKNREQLLGCWRSILVHLAMSLPSTFAHIWYPN